MKRYLLSACILFATVMVHAQPCVTYEGYGLVQAKYGINVFGQQATGFPVVPLYWNRFYKLNETTGLLESPSCAYPADPNIHELGACACILGGFYFRKVTPSCDPTPCGGDIDLPVIPQTNNNNVNSNWSAPSTWLAGQVPDIISSVAVLIAKPFTIDANLNVPVNHALLLSGGLVTVQAGKTIALNSILQMNATAQLQNFGTLKGNGYVVGSLTNSGILSPGNSPGKFTIHGNYTATSTAIHQMEIASPTLYDTIAVEQDISAPGGTAVLDGTLIVTLLNGFTPSSGETYTIMTFGASSGAFTNVNLPVLRSGLSWVVNYNATSITLGVTGVLPVNITSLNATSRNNGVQTDWSTASEVSVDRYEIQRSNDGTVFNLVGSVQSKGGSTNHYSWFDASPANGKNYYRLRAIDLDGTWKYSKIVVADMSAGAAVAVFPNPVTINAPLQLQLNNMTATSIDIVNMAGQTLYHKTGSMSGTISIPVSATWVRGQYMLRIASDKQLLIKKIVVQ